MEKANRQARKALDHLYAILDAGERGYAVAAANVSNRALKMLFKTYVKQRTDFKIELARQIENLRADSRSLIGVTAMIHRGSINIFTALTIGEENRERVIMNEAPMGERAAPRAYEQALGSPLPAQTRKLVQKQYESVQDVVGQVRLMRGVDGRQLVVRLYDNEADASRAAKALRQADFDPAAGQRVPVQRETAS